MGLIETLWNVNFAQATEQTQNMQGLIETLWNVNF